MQLVEIIAYFFISRTSLLRFVRYICFGCNSLAHLWSRNRVFL